jgi:two-component system, NtrC family, sensor kinase
VTTATVLIIDDSAEIRALLESLLPYAGYKALSAGTGIEGLRLAFDARPDALLLDLELPDTSGLKILEQLNRAGLNIPAVIMTGYGSEGVAASAVRLGALGYLIKPFTSEEVLASVEKALTVGRLAGERAKLSALLRRHGRCLQVLSVLAQALANGMERDPLLQRLVEAAQFLTGADGAWLSLRQEDTGRFRVVACSGRTGRTGLEFGETAGAQSLASALANGTLVRDLAAPGQTIRLQTQGEALAVFQAPLGGPGAVVGLLSVERQEEAVAFSDQDEYLLLILASYALLAVKGDGGASSRRRRLAGHPDGRPSPHGGGPHGARSF